MKVKLVAFGIAKDILRSRSIDFDFQGKNIQELKKALVQDYSEFSTLTKISFAVGEEYREDDFELTEAMEVVIIPPVSGG